MEAYRDQYATIFNGGKRVVALSVSVDADTTLANWAREAGFPMLFGSDPDQTVGRLYGSTRGKYEARNVFVIGPDGRITHRIAPLNVLAQDAYTELGAAIRATLDTTGAHAGGR